MTVERTQKLANDVIRSFRELVESDDPKMSSPAVVSHLTLFCIAMLAGQNYDKLNDDDLKAFLSAFSKTLFHGLRSVDEMDDEAREIIGRYQ